jgi:hypothetical protein
MSTACIRVDAFECNDDAGCVRGGVHGFCEAEHVCSYPDEACESMRRYSPHAGALADECVVEEEATSCASSCDTCVPVDVGARAFIVCDDALPWSEARDDCARRSMTLASIHSVAEQEALEAVVPTVAWIGLHDRDVDDAYAWDDGSAFDFAAWGMGEPEDADGEEDCVALGEGGWSAWRCEIPQRFVCAR